MWGELQSSLELRGLNLLVQNQGVKRRANCKATGKKIDIRGPGAVQTHVVQGSSVLLFAEPVSSSVKWELTSQV